MKRTFLAKRNALLSGQQFSWGVGAFGVVIVLVVLRMFAPNFFLQIFSPVFRGSTLLAEGSAAFFSQFADTAKLVALNEKLANENAALAMQNQTLTQKNSNLEDLLGANKTEKQLPSILAGVVARPPVSPYDTLVLASGERDGITLGQEVFATAGVPIGIISSVSGDFSRVTLFTSPDMTMSGWVGHASRAVTLIGGGAGTLVASMSRDANIAVGDVVFIPGPGQLPVGSVVRIDSDPLDPSVTLHIQLAVNLFETAWVAVRTTGVTPFSFATSTLP